MTLYWGFNPRSRAGSDSVLLRRSILRAVFQSTLPRGERPPARQSPGLLPVSIHAPARGATVVASLTYALAWFQSTLPRGERRNFNQTKGGPYQFQSTLPRGERQRCCFLNVRARLVSIHAPARGATRAARRFAPYRNVSIHAPARGATSPAQDCEHRRDVSIHAPARGATAS